MPRQPQSRTAPVQADFGFSIHVKPSGRGGSASAVSVEAGLARFGLKGFVLMSSDRGAPNIEGGRWPDGARWSIVDRLRNEGARKGRVLTVWQGDQVVAACSWHLHQTGPPIILDLACRQDLDPTVAKLAAAALLLCLRQIAGSSGIGRDTSSLRWADLALDRIPDSKEQKRIRGAVRARAQALDFGPMRPRPKSLTGRWAVERRF